MKPVNHQDSISSTVLQSHDSDDSFEDFINTTNEHIDHSDSKPRNFGGDMLPSHSPDRNPRGSKELSKLREFPKMRNSLNMRGASDKITQSQGVFHVKKESDSIPGQMNRSQTKFEQLSQKSGRAFNMKYQQSEANSRANSHQNVDQGGKTPRETNLRLHEIQSMSPREDIIDRDIRAEGVRTPSQFGNKNFSRRESERFLPKKSGSSLSRTKAVERELINKKFSSKKRYETGLRKKENDELILLRNKVIKLTMQLQGRKTTDAKLRMELEEMNKRNLVLKEQVVMARKKTEQAKADTQSINLKYQDIKNNLESLLMEYNNVSITGKHQAKMNDELMKKLRMKDEEIENIHKQINDNFTQKLREDNQREELTQFNLQNPYDKKAVTKGARQMFSPLEQNNSTYTQNTNLVYSEEQSAYSGIHKPTEQPLKSYLQSGKNPLHSLNANSLEGTFVSKHNELTDNVENLNNSLNEEYGSDHYHVGSLIFNKNRESSTLGQHNMTFGDGTQQFKYKISEKKVGRPAPCNRQKSEHSEHSINYQTFEGSMTQNLLETNDFLKNSSHNHSKNKSETLNIIAENFPPFLATVSDSKRQRSFTLNNQKNFKIKSSCGDLKKLVQNQPNSSSTQLTRGATTQENYASNDPGDTSHVPSPQNPTFQFLNSNSNPAKSQHSLSSRFTQKNTNFHKSSNLKQSNSHAQEQFPKSQVPGNLVQSFAFAGLNSQFGGKALTPETQIRSPEFRVHRKDTLNLCKISAKELNNLIQLNQNKVQFLEASLGNSQRLIKQNRILTRKSELMSTYMVELEKKLKVVSEICEKMTIRFNAEESICRDYQKTLATIMKKLVMLAPHSQVLPEEHFEGLAEQVSQLLSNQNLQNFKSFLSHQNQPKQSFHYSPPRVRDHQRRTSSMKSLTGKKNRENHRSKELLSHCDSGLVNNENKNGSMFSQPVDRSIPLEAKESRRPDLRQSEIIHAKKYERPSRKLIKKDLTVSGKNLIRDFNQDSDLGESLNEYDNTSNSDTDELYKDIMNSENISNFQGIIALYSLLLTQDLHQLPGNLKPKRKFEIHKEKNNKSQAENLPGKIQHRQVHTLSDLKKSCSHDKGSASRRKNAHLGKDSFKKKIGMNVFRKESINRSETSNIDADSLDTDNLEAELTEESLNSIDASDKVRPGYMKTLGDNFRVNKGTYEEQLGIKNLDKQRQLLKQSKSKFGKKKPNDSVHGRSKVKRSQESRDKVKRSQESRDKVKRSLESRDKVKRSLESRDKVKRSLESKDKASVGEEKNSRGTNIGGRRTSKEPPYKPVVRKAQYGLKSPRNQNSDFNNKMKMSFRKSGSFSKRSRLLRTEDEEESHSADNVYERKYRVNREKLKNEMKLHQTPHWNKVRKEGAKPEFNEYYDEIHLEEEERMQKGNPSEFDSDLKVSDSSGFINKIDKKVFENVKNKFGSKYSSNNVEESESESEKSNGEQEGESDTDSGRYKRSTVKLSEDEIDQLIPERIANRVDLRVKSEIKRATSPAEKALHSSNIEPTYIDKQFNNILDEQEIKKKERNNLLEEIMRENNEDEDERKMKLIFMDALNTQTRNSYQDNEQEEEQFTRKVSNLELEFYNSQNDNKTPYKTDNHIREENMRYTHQIYEEGEPSEEESYEAERQARGELLSENYFPSQHKESRGRQYMNPASYTAKRNEHSKKYILESNVSPGGSEGVSLISLSNQKRGSIGKLHRINRHDAFLSSSKHSQSDMYSSRKKLKMKNMASIEQQNEYNQIEEASISKEEFSKSRNNHLNFMYDDRSKSLAKLEQYREHLNDLASPRDLEKLIQDLRRKTMHKLDKFKVFYDHSKIFVRKVEQQMHVILNLTADDQLSFKKIKVAATIPHEKTRVYFLKHEAQMNNLLRNFMLLVCRTKLDFTQEILKEFYKSLSTLFPKFILLSFGDKMNSLTKLRESQETDVFEINARIQDFIRYFFINLSDLSPQKSALSYSYKTQEYVQKLNNKKGKTSKMQDRQVSVVRENFTHYFSREANRFTQILQVEENYESETRNLNKEEVSMLIENFEAFNKKCYKPFFEMCDATVLYLNSQNFDSTHAFLDQFQSRVLQLYILEKHAKSKIFRKVHRTVLGLNFLIVSNFGAGKSNNDDQEENTITMFKLLIKKVDSCISAVLKNNQLGSVELLYNRLLTHKNECRKIDREDLLLMLKKCAIGDFEFAVDCLYKKNKRKSLRYSTSFNFKRSRTSNRLIQNHNFLDYDSLDYTKNGVSSLKSLGDCDGVLLDQSQFYDASIDILRNYLQLNKLLLSHFIPNLF